MFPAINNARWKIFSCRVDCGLATRWSQFAKHGRLRLQVNNATSGTGIILHLTTYAWRGAGSTGLAVAFLLAKR
jgi:hypothetical protein